ncbi:MAG: hypothetical protein U0165_02500 [Polyangiaceae bacterium]
MLSAVAAVDGSALAALSAVPLCGGKIGRQRAWKRTSLTRCQRERSEKEAAMRAAGGVERGATMSREPRQVQVTGTSARISASARPSASTALGSVMILPIQKLLKLDQSRADMLNVLARHRIHVFTRSAPTRFARP